MEQEVYKVLIADDEYWTREKYCNMIEWSRYSLSCMEPAVDGEDVLKKLQQEPPHILITDINMPFMNGVELLQCIHKQYPDIITFVISGYDDFHYVRDAFLAGSIHYLVKPITKIDLVNALSRALEIISSRQHAERQKKEQQIKLLKASSLLQDREFSQLLEREEAPFTPIITMNSNMDFAGMSLMLVKIHDMENLAGTYGYDMNLLSYSVKKEIRKCLKNEELFIFNHIYRPNEFAIISELDNSELIEKAKYLMVTMKPLFQSPLTIIISSHSYTIDSIHQAYIQNIAMLMRRKYLPEDVLLVSDRRENLEENKKINRFSDSLSKELKELLKLGNRGAIETLIFQKTNLDSCVERGWEYLEVKQTVKRILNVFWESMASGMHLEEAAYLENLIHMSDRMIEKLNVSCLREMIEEAIDYTLSAGHEETIPTVPDIIRQAANYIDENYFEELSLSTLSKKFGVENSYFSRMFRQETGENLMLYIARKKMEKAREYICNTDISLTEIAFMIGYDDYAYFSRVFKKTYGKSPREYRNTKRCLMEEAN